MSSLTLTNIQNQLNLYGYSMLILLGNIGNTFIVIHFWKQRQHPCSLYLLCAAIVSILYLTLGGFIRIFPIYYGDGAPYEFALCKLSFYLPAAIGQVTKTMLVFASIDRFLITSDRVSFRALSTSKRAKYLIIFTVIFWLLLSSPLLIIFSIINGQCTTPPGIYSTYNAVYILISIGFFPPVTSGIFTYLTYCNMRRQHTRVQPITNNTTNTNAPIRQRDRELLVLVISEVFVYMVTAGLFPIIRLEIMITGYTLPNKSFQYSQIESLILNISYLLLYSNSGTTFYTYFIVSKPFRREFKQLTINGYRKLRREPPAPVTFRRNETLAQRETRV